VAWEGQAWGVASVCEGRGASWHLYAQVTNHGYVVGRRHCAGGVGSGGGGGFYL